jgi:peptide deformylase
LVDAPVSDERLSDGTYLVQLMTALGIVQKGSPILDTTARPFTLPAERAEAEDVVGRLHEAADRVQRKYPFTRGMGLAAPQIGIDRRAVLVRPGHGERWIELLNPTVVAMDGQQKHYEGCLSFFGVRGLVTRPSRITVEHTAPHGDRIVSLFDSGTAGLVMHEIDHIDGTLYDRRTAGALLPVAEYRVLTAAGWTA